MCVQANLQGTDERLVYLVRTSECRCSDGIVVDEIGVALPIANLDLNKLTELTDLIPEGTEARCLCCGRVNPVDYRAGFVIPADSAELALAWVVPTGGSGQLMLVQPAETDDPTVVSRLAAALYEPRLCNPVEFDEFAVLESWGRPLSVHACLRRLFADFLKEDDASSAWQVTDGCLHLFVNDDDWEPLVDEEIAQLGWPNPGVIPYEGFSGRVGSVADVLTLDPSGASRIVGIVDLDRAERASRAALSNSPFALDRVDGGSTDRELIVRIGPLEASLPLIIVGGRALVYGLTVEEAAVLEVERLRLRLNATIDAADALTEAAGKRACVLFGEDGIRLVDGGGRTLGDIDLPAMLETHDWHISKSAAADAVNAILGSTPRTARRTSKHTNRRKTNNRSRRR